MKIYQSKVPTSASAYGLDGCPAGWVVTALSSNNDCDFAVYGSLSEWWSVVDSTIHFALIDIPVGLLAAQAARDCDANLRKHLGRRRSSVFAVPVREAVFAEDYRQACAINAAATGKKFSIQSWNIVPKIREADRLLDQQPRARTSVAESHPEWAFMQLTGSPMQHNKKTEAGYQERMAALLRARPQAVDEVEAGLRAFKRKQVRRDDLVDAYALAVHARRIIDVGGWEIPKTPQFDPTDKAVRMCCGRFDGIEDS